MVHGHYHRDGTHGVKQDYAKAATYYTKAATGGNPEGMYNLALLYARGRGVERDSKISLMWLNKAAEMPTNTMFWQTRGRNHFQMGAQRNDVKAMLNLADCYLCAHGTGSIIPLEKDTQQSMVWLQRAASLGNLEAANKLEKLKQSRVESLLPLIPPKADLLNCRDNFGVVSERAKQGSVTAAHVLQIWEHMQSAMTAFKNNEHAELVAELSAAIHLDQQNVEIPELFHGAINERMKKHADELEVNTCYVHVNTRGNRKGRLGSVLEKFPMDPFFLEMAIMNETLNGDTEKALELVEKGLKLHKTLADNFYYLKGTIYARIDEPSKKDRAEMNKSFDDFLAVAATDHPKVPCAYYRKALYHLGNKNTPQFAACYEADAKKSSSSQLCFSDPHRRLLLVKSRQLFAYIEDQKNQNTPVTSATPILSAQPPSLVSLKPITLRDIDATKDHVYDGYVLQLKVINWPHTINAVFLQVSDETDFVQKMAIYNWPNTTNKQELMKTFPPNRTLCLINPHMRIALDGESILHVQSPAYIVLGTAPLFDQSCHCCGAQGQTMKCSSCKLARYCSKQCQKHDWTEFGHKLVCQSLKKYSGIF
uniref:MYND-type domain-containing protein n=1 Tax=Ditylenchus dipsaci TaxID=166011 RepID=A0A915DS64_9BILA